MLSSHRMKLRMPLSRIIATCRTAAPRCFVRLPSWRCQHHAIYMHVFDDSTLRFRLLARRQICSRQSILDRCHARGTCIKHWNCTPCVYNTHFCHLRKAFQDEIQRTVVLEYIFVIHLNFTLINSSICGSYRANIRNEHHHWLAWVTDYPQNPYLLERDLPPIWVFPYMLCFTNHLRVMFYSFVGYLSTTNLG